MDYKFYTHSILLKASLLHDLLEDLPDTQADEIREIDHELAKAVDLVLEVTKSSQEPKEQYLLPV